MILIEGGLDSFTLNLGGPKTKKVEKHCITTIYYKWVSCIWCQQSSDNNA